MKILAISGSLRAGSFNSRAVQLAVEAAPAGTTIEVADLADIPPYNEDVYANGFPPAVEAFRDAIRGADALLVSTPEYNYSISGVLKNAIDWASRPPEQPFDGKPVAVMGCSAGPLGAARAQYHLRQVFVFLNGHVLNKPEVMIGAAHTVFDADGSLTDDSVRTRIGDLVQALIAWAGRLQ